jgi:hypothetical protein
MNSIIQYNRETLSFVKKWIERKDWEIPNSIFNYGLPDSIFDLINLPINNDITEVDMICNYFLEFEKPINYLEIGVSVGKTFYQIIKFSQNYCKFNNTFSCIDIEHINPKLEKILDDMSITKTINKIEVDNTLLHSIRKKNKNVITKWDNNITYYESDEFDTNIWKNMIIKYNFIFSDALHEPNALITEYKNIQNNNLLDETGFIYCFDDLENDKNQPMWQAVYTIYNDMKLKYGLLNISIDHFYVNGWIGQYEHIHNFGVIRGVKRT